MLILLISQAKSYLSYVRIGPGSTPIEESAHGPTVHDLRPGSFFNQLTVRCYGE